MADFETAFKKTARVEGGYSNDPDDRGGETWRGIARNFHPDWPGWMIVDDHRNHPDFPGVLSTLGSLEAMEKVFYKKEYWDRIRGDDIPVQAIADEMYDTAVNIGRKAAVRFLQEVLNVLNDAGLAEDGQNGAQTLMALHKCLKRYRRDIAIVKALNGLQFMHYWTLAEEKPKYKKWLAGWIIDRVDFLGT